MKEKWAFLFGPFYIGVLISGLLLFSGSLIYIIYGFVSGFVSNYPSFPPLAQEIILYKFSLSLQLLTIGYCLLLLAIFLRYLFSFEVAFILLLIGLFLYLAIPFILGTFFLSGGLPTIPMHRVLLTTHTLGIISFVFSGILFLGEIFYLLRSHFATKDIITKEKIPSTPYRRTSLLSSISLPCWDTPFCREFLREFCPAWARKRSCWKVGGGCLCDEAIVEQMISQTSVRQPESARLLKRTSQLMQKKHDCLKCPIYTEHQRQKYRWISFLIPLSILALFIFGRGGIHNYYLSIARFFDNLFSNLAYLPTTSGKILTTLSTPWLETTILIIFALFLMGLLLHLLEYFLFSLGW